MKSKNCTKCKNLKIDEKEKVKLFECRITNKILFIQTKENIIFKILSKLEKLCCLRKKDCKDFERK